MSSIFLPKLQREVKYFSRVTWPRSVGDVICGTHLMSFSLTFLHIISSASTLSHSDFGKLSCFIGSFKIFPLYKLNILPEVKRDLEMLSPDSNDYKSEHSSLDHRAST